MYNIFLNNIKAARKLKTQKNIAEVSLSILECLFNIFVFQMQNI